ncbi:DUF3108 domain-containing protein [Roseateles asaccharophilus]|uniref:DUF3108 domain-containing protein n=1 Tax=Roseateles asaccharophilus TaxID=582607 RepID=A0ABU2ADK2_9BURK|nr:DUF3108 domain-containing protein [Roseateles asaccharophilus]MDR7334678.1 hypothetical protein [Roseateles asaccharophilus]
MKTPRPPWLLVLCVLALHLWLGQEVQRIHEGWQRDGPPPMPPRMQVEFVREMVLQPPPAVARMAAPPPAIPARGAAAAASEPLPMPEPPASTPEPVAEAPPVAAPEVVAAAASAPVTDEPGPEWPLSTRLSYVLTGNYRGSVHGQAQVEWLRQGRDYQVHLDVGVGPSFAPLISRRMSSQGKLTPEGIAPQRYDEETRVILGDARRATVLLQGTEVQLANGARQPVARGAQDSASQFVQLTWLFLTGREPLEAGRVINFPLVLPYRQYAWQYQVVGEELLDTPMGPVASWHLKPTRGVAGGDLLAEVWLAPSLQFLPVRLVIRQDADTYIDLMLKSAPLQAAPE